MNTTVLVSANDVFHRLASSKWQFCTARDAWVEFLAYLENRRGVDLGTLRGMAEIRLAFACVEQGHHERFTVSGDPDVEWFLEFSTRPAVTEALCKFLDYRGIPSSFVLDVGQ